MMKNIIIVLIVITTQSYVNSQELLPVVYDTTSTESTFSLSGNAFHLSSAVKNSFSRKWLYGGEITDEIKTESYDNHNIYERIGGGYRLSLEYRSNKQLFKKHPNLSWLVNVSNEGHFASEYSSGLFGLLFFGNERFQGEEINLSNSKGSFVDYLTIGGGIHNVKTKSYVSLNVILPRSYYNFSIPRGSFIVSEDADRMDLMLQASIESSASSAFFQGLGAALSFDYNLPFGDAEKGEFHGVFRISGRNLGAYQLNKVDRSSIDTEINFEGFSFQDIQNTSDQEDVFMSTLKDTLNVESSTSSEWRVIPGFIQIGKIVENNPDKKLQSFFGIRMYTNTIYRPLVYAGVDYRPIEKFSFGTQGTFGGYGVFRLGLYANYSTEKMNIGLGSEDILGLALESQYGQSAVIRLLWKL